MSEKQLVVGQLHEVRLGVVIEARKCRLKFHFNPYLRDLEPVEFRVPADEVERYPDMIDGLRVVADPEGVVEPGRIFLCCPDPDPEGVAV